MKITCFSDYACPFCYIGEVRLNKAMAELNIENQVKLELRAFELNPNAQGTSDSDTPTRFAKKYNMSIEEAREKVEYISRLGREEGLDFNYVSAKATNTFDAHRLMKFALSKNNPEIAHKTNNGLFDAYFSKSLRLSAETTLLAVAELAGLDRDETLAMLKSSEFISQVRDDEREAARLGIHGVPYFIFENGIAVPGAASTADFKKILAHSLELEKRLWDVESCGPDGCLLN